MIRQDDKYYVVLNAPYPTAELFGTNRFMARKIQAKFYVDDDLWLAAQAVFDAMGHKYSEGMSRLLVDFLQSVKSKQAGKMLKLSVEDWRKLTFTTIPPPPPSVRGLIEGKSPPTASRESRASRGGSRPKSPARKRKREKNGKP